MPAGWATSSSRASPRISARRSWPAPSLTSLLAIVGRRDAAARRAPPARRHGGARLMLRDCIAWLPTTRRSSSGGQPASRRSRAPRSPPPSLLALPLGLAAGALAAAWPTRSIAARQRPAHDPEPRPAGHHAAAARHRLPAVGRRAHALRPAGDPASTPIPACARSIPTSSRRRAARACPIARSCAASRSRSPCR